MYTSVKNEKIKKLNKLKTKKYRDKEKLFLVEGKHLVTEAYNKGYLKELYLKENINFKLDVPTYYINDTVLKYLSSVKSPTGIIGLCIMKDMHLKGNKLLILDEVQDPGNLGTIIRSSVAFGIDTIVIEKCADIYSDKVIRSSEGLIFKANIINKDILPFLKSIKGNIPIYGTKVNGGKVLKTLEKSEKFAIIMGNEGSGVKKDILDICDEYLYIPMQNCESLNVGVATSIILYELVR